MHLCFFQHRNLNDSRLIYMAGSEANAEINVEAGAKDKNELPNVEILKYDPTKKTADEHWAIIEEKYGKNAYESLISAYVDKIMPKSPENYKKAILRGSTKRYAEFYNRIRGIFMANADKIERAFNYSVEHVVDKTKSELGILKSAVEGSRGLTEFTDAMPAPEDKNAVEDHFDKYLKVMNGRYFNADVNEGIVIPGYGIPVLDPLLNPDLHALPDPAYPKERSAIPIFGIFTGSDVFKGSEYKSKSSDFQSKMEDWVEAKLAWLLNKKGTTKKDLEAFKREIADRYDIYSRIDGSSSIVSGKDLAGLEYLSKPPLDAIGWVLDGSDESVIKRLEVIQLMNPDVWGDTIKTAEDMVIQTALNNGMEKDFIKAAGKYKKVTDFDDAVDVFEEHLAELSKVSVTETLAFLREFNTEVNSEVLDYEKDISPKGIAMQVNKQIDYLLGGVLKPHWEEDRMIVRFMTAGREERHAILGNDAQRSILFRGIKLATTRYPEIFDRMIGNREKFTRSVNIVKPTKDDQAAQLKALIILANQSKVIVSKLNKTPRHRGKDFMAEIDQVNIPDDAKQVNEGLKFSAPGTKRARFQSALERGGFNTRDLALKGVKILGILTIISNAGQSFSETEGDFVDRIFQTGEKMVTNQGVLVGAAVAVGAHLAERNPAFLKYPWLSKYNRQKIMVEFKLENIAARLGKNGTEKVKRFTHNNAEWRALSHDKMTGDRIRELVKDKAEEAKGGQKPVITVQDLSKIISEPSILSTLTRGGRSARMRYLFYSKFFARPVKPDVNRMKEICAGTGYISPSPASSKKS